MPVTVLEVGPCRVVQRKTAESDGYEAVQIGLVEKRPPRSVTEARRGHFKKAGVEAMRHLAEVRVEAANESQPGDEIDVEAFDAGNAVHRERLGNLARTWAENADIGHEWGDP